MSSLSQGNPLKQHVRLLPSSSISLIKKAHFYPFCPWGLHRGLENQQTELLSFSPTIYSLSFHLLFYPICLSSLHILSHAPSLISHLFSPRLSPVSILCCFTFFCSSLAVTYFSFSAVYFSHIPATSSVACHHPGCHSSSLYHPFILWNHWSPMVFSASFPPSVQRILILHKKNVLRVKCCFTNFNTCLFVSLKKKFSSWSGLRLQRHNKGYVVEMLLLVIQSAGEKDNKLLRILLRTIRLLLVQERISRL